ncbi:MAG: CHAT domain-containing protein, partial [Bacteroidota bacterium]
MSGLITHTIEGAIGTNYLLAQRMQDDTYLSNALSIMQLYHARSVQDMLLERQAEQITLEEKEVLLPDLIQIEKRLSLIANKLQRELLGPRPEGKRYQLIEQEYLDIKGKYAAGLNLLKEKAPLFYQLKYEPAIFDVEAARDALPDQQTAILHYFVGDTNTYLFGINQDTSFLMPLGIGEDSLQTLVAGFRKQVERWNQPTDSLDAIASQLYQHLIEAWADQMPETQWIIIPDGPLQFLPFEALTVSTSSGKEYVLLRKTISYAHSLSELLRSSERENKHQSPYVGFAPVFPRSAKQGNSQSNTFYQNWPSLPMSAAAVQEASTLWQGESYVLEEAQESVFREKGLDAQVLHFATHAVVDWEFPVNSKIVFAVPKAVQNTRNDGYLHVYELFRLRLASELVVLSACETGLGLQNRGE